MRRPLALALALVMGALPLVASAPPVDVAAASGPTDAELLRALAPSDRFEPEVMQRRGVPRQAAGRTQPDFDNDGKADIGVFIPVSQNRFFAVLSNGGVYNDVLGNQGTQSIPVPGDYDGDGRTDRALYISPQARYVYVPSSAPNTLVSVPIGDSSSLPVPGDYDGDGKWDPAVYLQTPRLWFVVKSTGGTISTTLGGSINDVPVPADYDFDGRTDISVWTPSTGNWFVLQSGGGTRQVQIGQEGNITVPADYDGDGKADIAVWNQFNGQWFIIRANNQIQTYLLGGMGHFPVPADYDGDNIADPGVYVESNGLFFIQKTTGGFINQVIAANQIPLSKRPSPNSYPYGPQRR